MGMLIAFFCVPKSHREYFPSSSSPHMTTSPQSEVNDFLHNERADTLCTFEN